MFRSFINKSVATALAISIPSISFAQDAKQLLEKAPEGYNQLSVLLIIMMIVLAFVIWGMGQVLVALGRQLVDKNKHSSKILSVVLFAGLSLLSQHAFAQGPGTAEAIKSVPNYGGLSANTFYLFITILSTEVIVILFLAFSIRRMYAELLPVKVNPPVGKSKLGKWWNKLDKKIFTKAVSVEKEADILLDHEYDGIRELDNSLPPWWKWGFYITICISIIYLLNFHVLGLGKNPTEEYNTEVGNARIAKEIFDAKNKDRIDENNVPMADATGILAGKKMYEANCVACHLADGGGSVGPNLTDDYWLHKGSMNDIYNSIKVGYPDKGMQSWITKFNPKEISQISSYIKSLHGTKPASPKMPQGDIYSEKADSIIQIKKDTLVQ